MSYVQRDNDGLIVGVFARKQEGIAEEFVPGEAELYQDPAQVFAEQRRSEYQKDGVTIEAMIVALWEGDQAVIDGIESKRQLVKIRVPKI